MESATENENEELKKFTLRLLKEADIVIKDFSVEIEERAVDNNLLLKIVNEK